MRLRGSCLLVAEKGSSMRCPISSLGGKRKGREGDRKGRREGGRISVRSSFALRGKISCPAFTSSVPPSLPPSLHYIEKSVQQIAPMAGTVKYSNSWTRTKGSVKV